MGDNLQSYRMRIGMFGPGRGYRPKASNSQFYQPGCKWDTCYRLLATFNMIGLILGYCRIAMGYRDYKLRDVINLCSGSTTQPHYELAPVPHHVTCILSADASSGFSLYSRFQVRQLILSSDIETNPGPLSDSESAILTAIKESEARELDEIRDVKSKINDVKQELAEVKSECVKTKQDINGLKSMQLTMDSDIKTLQSDVKYFDENRHTMQLDIDDLNERFESKLELLDDLARNVEHLERESRKSTMRVFGLPENENVNPEVLKALVAEKVLKAACPHKDWEPDDMIRAFRAGKATDDQPRMVIVTFRYSDDKFRIHKNNLRTLLSPDFMLSFIQSIQDYSVDISVVLDKFLEIFYKCGSMCASVKKSVSKKHSKCFDEGCKKLKQEKVRLLRQFRRLRTPENLDIYKRSRQTFKSHCNAKKSVYNSNVLDDLVSSHTNPKSFWNKLKRLAGASTTHNNISKEQWKAHFEMLFASQEFERDTANDNAIDDNIEYNILDDELEDIVFNSAITDEEIIKAIKSLKRGKSSGQDELITEFFIHSIDFILPLINSLFNRIFDTGNILSASGLSILVTLFKKGNPNNPGDYRGISLLDVIGKIYTGIITRRITFYTNIYSKISEIQAGFREGYSAMDDAFVLYSLINKCLLKKKGKLYVAFVDLTKPLI